MTKSEARNNLIEWLREADTIKHRIVFENRYSGLDEWFSKCAEMYAAYKAIRDHSTGADMPIDRPALDMEDFVNDGCNGFTRQ